MRSATIELWNRRLHIYLGLFLLLFLWLFSLTGLLLNHPEWSFAEFWPNRKEALVERRITPPPAGSDLAQAHELMRQLGFEGEIEWITTRADPSHFDFRVSRPGHMRTVKANFAAGTARIQQIDLNAWGVLHILHTFTGVRLADQRNSRDWVLTSVWAWSMDAVAAALIFEVLSSLYLWWGLRRRKPFAVWALLAGCTVCGWYVFGLSRFLL